MIGHKRNGVKPGHFGKASSNILRKCLQALENVNLVEKTTQLALISFLYYSFFIWIYLLTNISSLVFLQRWSCIDKTRQTWFVSYRCTNDPQRI